MAHINARYRVVGTAALKEDAWETQDPTARIIDFAEVAQTHESIPIEQKQKSLSIANRAISWATSLISSAHYGVSANSDRYNATQGKEAFKGLSAIFVFAVAVILIGA